MFVVVVQVTAYSSGSGTPVKVEEVQSAYSSSGDGAGHDSSLW